MVTMAKGVASSYAAIACLVTTEEVFDMFKDDPSDPMSYFRDISTFGGCTAGPAAAIENMAIIEEEGLLENCTNIKLFDGLLARPSRKAPHDYEVKGKGLFAGLSLLVTGPPKSLCQKQSNKR